MTGDLNKQKDILPSFVYSESAFVCICVICLYEIFFFKFCRLPLSLASIARSGGHRIDLSELFGGGSVKYLYNFVANALKF